jgi:CRISPR-associated protein Cmr1
MTGGDQPECFLPFTTTITLDFDNLDEVRVNEIRQAMECLICFGGLGGRTRRGFGALWHRDLTLDRMKVLSNEFRGNDIETPISNLSQSRLFVTNAEYSDVYTAWRHSMALYESFRKGNSPLATDRLNQGRPEGVRHTRWPEANVIRRTQQMKQTREVKLGEDNPFPRADLGLPISFQSNGSYPFSNITANYGINGMRWPSPVLIRPFKVSANKFVGLILILGGPSPCIDMIHGGFSTTDCSIWPQAWYIGSGNFQNSTFSEPRARDKFAAFIRSFAASNQAGQWEEVT